MFDFSIIHEPVASRQRAAIGQVIDRAVRSGTITYTDILLAPEPVRTMALEHLDGTSSAQGLPQTTGSPINFGPIRVVCLEPNDSITISRWERHTLFGTAVESHPQKVPVKLGNDVQIDDIFPDRTARNVLRSKGFPIRDVNSRGTNSGAVVEWKWLERVANSNDATEQVKSVYNAILARMTEPAKAIKSKGAQQPLANP